MAGPSAASSITSASGRRSKNTMQKRRGRPCRRTWSRSGRTPVLPYAVVPPGKKTPEGGETRYGKSRIHRTGSDGRKHGRPPPRKRPQCHGLQPHASEGGLAGETRHEAGGVAKGGGGSRRRDLHHGHQRISPG